MAEKPKKIVSASLPEETHARLRTLADDTLRTIPGYIRMLVNQHLRQLDKPQNSKEVDK